MQFNYFIPNITEGRLAGMGTITWDALLTRARAAEELGFDTVGVGEFIQTQQDVGTGFPGEPPRNFAPISIMGALAAATPRIRISTLVLVLPYHDPLILGREIATLDNISGGRITLGVGIGGESEDYRRTRQQLGTVNRSQLMDESLEAMRLLWTEPYASFHGDHFAFDDLQTYPKPIQQPFPVYLAGNTDGLMRRTAKFGQGWIQMTAGPELMRRQIDQLRAYTEDAGRDPSEVRIVRQCFTSIAATDDAAWENQRTAVRPKATPRARKGIAQAQSEQHERLFVGSPDTIRRRLHAFAEIGVDEIGFTMFEADTDAALRQLELLATKVIPDFRS
ncbi:MAG: TIGR03619 family F420-dependent LLM class oxidoreductase [Thermomicrobiales bacterium]|nr:TIGR03619 family F420-dependent LLM class oxidoreductase [Thermomicrobiales bacterium]